MKPRVIVSQNSCDRNTSESWFSCGILTSATGVQPRRCNLTGVEDDHGDGERHQAEQLGRGEAEDQARELAVGGCRVAQRTLQERTEDDADAGGSGANADGGETGTEYLSRSEIHCITP